MSLLPFGSPSLFKSTTSTYKYVAPIDTTKHLLIGGTTTPTYLSQLEAIGEPTAIFAAANEGGGNFFINSAIGNSIIGIGGVFLSMRAKGTKATPTAISNGDFLTTYAGIGFDGTSYTISGPSGQLLFGMYIKADTTVSTGNVGQAIVFSDLLGSLERLRISSSLGIVFNDSGADYDIRMEGDTDQNLFFLDASTDRIGIGTSSPTSKLDVSDDRIRIRTNKTPASAAATGNQGDICWDSSYIYICTATDTWKRVAIATW